MSWFWCSRCWLLASFSIVVLTSCGHQTVSNHERAIIEYQDGKLCTEPWSPVERLNSLALAATASASVAESRVTPHFGGEVSASAAWAQTVSRIYDVSERLQFLHASLFRLCEAAASGHLESKDYARLYTRVVNEASTLVLMQGESFGDN